MMKKAIQLETMIMVSQVMREKRMFPQRRFHCVVLQEGILLRKMSRYHPENREKMRNGWSHPDTGVCQNMGEKRPMVNMPAKSGMRTCKILLGGESFVFPTA